MHAHLSKRGPEMLKLRLAITFSFVVRFECVTHRFDRANLTTRVNVFLCQSDAQNKWGPKTLNVHKFLCQGLFFGFLIRKAPCTL